MLCMALCACGKNDSASQMASDAVSYVETEASEMMSGSNGVVSDGDGIIGNETYDSTDNTVDYSDNTTATDASTNTATEAYM